MVSSWTRDHSMTQQRDQDGHDDVNLGCSILDDLILGPSSLACAGFESRYMMTRAHPVRRRRSPPLFICLKSRGIEPELIGLHTAG